MKPACCPPPSEKNPLPCCGGQAPKKGSTYIPGGSVEGNIDTPAGPVPRVRTKIALEDLLGRWKMRWGVGRDRFAIMPGLYAVGNPRPSSVVLVTANYKMTFDALRRELAGIDAWILVLDTRGINVWCAAGKGIFGTEELLRRIEATRLADIVTGRTLILPQLGATGVSAHVVGKESGFSVVYGPVYARDIKSFLENGMEASPRMRRVEFPARERLALTPVELVGSLKPAAWASLALFLLAGIGPGIFSPAASMHRGAAAVAGLAAGIFGGAVVTPLFLPWLPGKAFSAKGAAVGLLLAACAVLFGSGSFAASWEIPLLLALPAVSSFVAMNFTGATPFTSPSGVEKEMRRAIPIQALSATIAIIVWVGGAFTA